MTPEQTTLTAGIKQHFNDGHGNDGQSKEAASQTLSAQDKTLKKAVLIFFFYLFMSLLLIFLYSFIQKNGLIYYRFSSRVLQDLPLPPNPVSVLLAINIVPFIIPALGAAISYKILGRIQSGVLFGCFFIAITLSLVASQKPGLIFLPSYITFLITVSCFVGWCSKLVFDRDEPAPVLLIADWWGCFSVFAYFTIIGFVASIILDSGYSTLDRMISDINFHFNTENILYMFFSSFRGFSPDYYGLKLGVFAFFALIITLVGRYRPMGLSIKAVSKIIFIPPLILIYIVFFLVFRALGISLIYFSFASEIVINYYIAPICLLTLSSVFAFWLVANWYNRTSAQKTQG